MYVALIKRWDFDFEYNYSSSFSQNNSDKGIISLQNFAFEFEFNFLPQNNSYCLQILTLHLDFGDSNISFGNAKGFLQIAATIFNVCYTCSKQS
jgi:hypothetical protein